MKFAGFVLGAAAVSLSMQSVEGAAVSGTSAPAYQQEVQYTGSVPTGAPNTVRIHRDTTNETRGVYEFALPTLPVGGTYTSASLNYYVASATYQSGGASSLSAYGFAGNGRFDTADSNAFQFLSSSGPITDPGSRSDALKVGIVDAISMNSKSPWLGVAVRQGPPNASTSVSRLAGGPAGGGPGPIPSLSYAADVPNAGTLSTRAMVDVHSDKGTLTEGSMGGTVITTAETSGGVTDWRGILEFNLGGLPSGATVTSATLKFDVANFTRSSTDFGVTYNYANPRIYGYNGDGAATAADGSQTGNLLATGPDVTGTGDYSIALDPANLQALFGTNKLVGILVRGSADGNHFGFYSSDSTIANNVPVTLDVTYAVPEPASLGVLLFGAVALCSRRRR